LRIGCWFNIIQLYVFVKLLKLELLSLKEFLRKKPSTENSEVVHFVYPLVPDECEYMFDQIIGKVDPSTVLRRGIYQFEVYQLVSLMIFFY